MDIPKTVRDIADVVWQRVEKDWAVLEPLTDDAKDWFQNRRAGELGKLRVDLFRYKAVNPNAVIVQLGEVV